MKDDGYRRIHAEMKTQGCTINHNKVQRIIKKLGLKCEKSFQYTTCPSKSCDRRNWFKYTNDVKLYLSPIADLYNGEIIGVMMDSLNKRSPLFKSVPNIEQPSTPIKASTISTTNGYKHWNEIRFTKACLVKQRVQTMPQWKTSLAYWNRKCITENN